MRKADLSKTPGSRFHLPSLRVVFLCAVALLPIVALSIYTFKLAARSVEALVESDNAAVAISTAELLGHDLNQTVSAASAFAKLPGIVGGTERHNATQVRTLLQLAVESEPDVDRAAVLDLKGNLWSDFPEAPETIEKNFSTRDYYIGVTREWKPYVSEVFHRIAAPRPWVVAVAIPIRSKTSNEPIGILTYHVRLEKIAAWLRRITVGHAGYVVVLDHRGIVAAHARLTLEDHLHDEYARLPAVQDALRGRASSLEYIDPLARQRMVARFIPITVGSHNWVVIAQQPTVEAFAPIRKLEWEIGAAAATIGLLTIWLFAALERGRRVERESERFFNLSLDLLCIADLKGHFKRLNQAWERTLGFTTQELMAEPFFTFIHPDDIEPTNKIYARQISVGATIIHFENRYRCKDGSYRWLQWNAVPALAEARIFAAARDITDLKNAQAMLKLQHQLLGESAESERSAHTALKNTQTRLIQSERLAAVGQLVAGVAHEINNPLAFVTNNLAVLQRDIAQVRHLLQMYQSADPLLSEHNPALLERLREAAEACDLGYVLASLVDLPVRSREGLRRIQEIVRALLDMARVQTVGTLQERINLNEGIESTALIVQGLAKNRGVKVDLDLVLLPLITCDPKRINQVILNLLTNAVDACAAPGTVAEGSDQKKVLVRSRPDGDGVVVSVSDNGSGIDPAVLGKVFEPFFTTKPQGEGTGLGLSISHGIVLDHGGRIDVTSEGGQGTTFTVHLPAEPPAHWPHRAHPAQPTHEASEKPTAAQTA
jgi:PAS domain S-box-containing protein